MSSVPALIWELRGNLLDATEWAIVHQCNCVTRRAAGLAAAIAKKWPHADPYARRNEDRPALGSIRVYDAGRRVIALFAQWDPGRPGLDARDAPSARLGYFEAALLAIEALVPRPPSLAFPERIGCGLAGGEWARYRAALAAFAARNPDIRVVIVALPSPPALSAARRWSDGTRRPRTPPRA